jgi:hypothetical protein
MSEVNLVGCALCSQRSYTRDHSCPYGWAPQAEGVGGSFLLRLRVKPRHYHLLPYSMRVHRLVV